jgi:hypothetical protein
MRLRLVILFTLAVFSFAPLFAQISPGELSKVHEHLEGISNCTKCHEQGEEITGKKCLECHAEISDGIAAKHGYHFRTQSSTCVNCHKEHLGRDESITRFDKNNFDHQKTGYNLTGKHALLSCEACHTNGRIKNQVVAKNQKLYPHQTYLGLQQHCADCHRDRHANSLGMSCEKCHTSDGWKPAAVFSHAVTKYPLSGKHETLACIQCHETLKTRDASHPLLFSVKAYDDCTPCHNSPHGQKFLKQTCRTCHSPAGWQTVSGFDHSNTLFELTGKHKTVTCEKCHAGMKTKTAEGKINFTTKPFKDCMPCHASPHAASFSTRACSSCHTPQQWSSGSEKNFDHNLTSFPLRGKHGSLKCAQCHGVGKNQNFKNAFKLAKKACSDCHEDKHNGQFLQKYANDCSRCHTEDGYSPSTFTFDQHGNSRFVLSNSHLTVLCKDCHLKRTVWVFHFPSLTCESCHRDWHEGRFTEFMKEKNCDACHSSVSWKSVQFDHSRTSFPLIGQHANAACSRCHVKDYKGTGRECTDCHTDPHAGQFTDKGKVDCARCHTPIGRRALVFRHDLQSSFSLTGAHSKVECGACHRPEMRNGKFIVRYKPLSSKCESCHQGTM